MAPFHNTRASRKRHIRWKFRWNSVENSRRGAGWDKTFALKFVDERRFLLLSDSDARHRESIHPSRVDPFIKSRSIHRESPRGTAVLPALTSVFAVYDRSTGRSFASCTFSAMQDGAGDMYFLKLGTFPVTDSDLGRVPRTRDGLRVLSSTRSIVHSPRSRLTQSQNSTEVSTVRRRQDGAGWRRPRALRASRRRRPLRTRRRRHHQAVRGALLLRRGRGGTSPVRQHDHTHNDHHHHHSRRSSLLAYVTTCMMCICIFSQVPSHGGAAARTGPASSLC